jgi:HK97 family phage major capsid protein
MIARIKALREERAKLVADVRAILDKDNPTPEEYGKADELLNQEAELKSQIDTLERALDAAASADELADARAGRENVSRDQAADEIKNEAEVFTKFLRVGARDLDPAERQVLMGFQTTLDPQAVLTTGTGSSGGFTIPEGFRQQLDDAIESFGGMREVATIWKTDTGNDIPWPNSDDTGQTGAIVAESGDAFGSGTDPSFGQVVFNAYTYSSLGVKVPIQLLQDSAFDIPGKLAEWLGLRIARIQNTHFTVGDGTAKPAGIVTQAALGHTTVATQVDSIIYDDLVDLEHSVDPYHRKNGRFMFNDNTLKAVKKLKATDSDLPAWVPGIALREPDTILGYKYAINSDCADMAASAKAVVFGDLSKYIIRDVVDVTLVRLDELYMANLQVGFFAYARADGDLVDAGANAVKYMANAAS